MRKISFAWTAVLLCAVCKAQFFYNDDEQYQPAFQEPIQDNTYGYNSPPAVAQHNPGQPRSHSENFDDAVNYQAAPQPPPAPQYEQRPSPSRGRRRGVGQRQQQIAQLQPPPRVYSPSVFQNLGLGMPPAGVSIPEDSFLNVLRNDGRGVRARQSPVYEPAPPQQTSFVQPPAPQTIRAPVSGNLPYSGVAAAVPRRVQPIEAVPTAIQHQPQIRERPQTDQNPVQYQAPQAPMQAPLQPTPQRSSRRRSGARYRQATDTRSSWSSAAEEPQRPPRVYSPSVFENLGLGMAPSGIHVPEDSLLNILRNDKPNFRTRRNPDYQPAPPAAPVIQNAPNQYSDEPRTPTEPHTTEIEVPQQIPNVAPAPRRVHRQPPLQQRPQPEFVDNSANYQGVEEQQPQVVQHPKPVQNRRRVTVRRHRQYSGSTAGTDSNEAELNQPPKQFAPSVFEKIGLGEAPPGIYVPEDSFLNLLRGERPVTRAARRPVNQPEHILQATTPRRVVPDVTAIQNHPDSDYSIQQDSYDRQDRRSPLTYANQPPTLQHQNPPPQEYQEPANIEPQREYRRPVSQQIHQPAVAARPVQPPKRQRQRSQPQPIRAPEPHPVYDVSETIYNVGPDLQQEDDILRYSARDDSARTRQQEPVPQYRRENAAPRYAPPPQPVYEAPPQPNHNANSHSQQDSDIPRRRTQSGNQRRTQVQAPAQRQRTDSQSPPRQPQTTRGDEIPETRQQPRFKAAKLSVKHLPDDVDGDNIPGEAGVDYPTLHVIPSTSFSCVQQPHNGYYADLETSCQVVHMCQAGGVQSSFLCPNGTIFNQEKFSCQWWYKVNCENAPSHYAINDKLYKVPPKPSRRNKK